LPGGVAQAGDGAGAAVRNGEVPCQDRRRVAIPTWAKPETSADSAGRFDVIRVEDLKTGYITRPAKGSIDQPGRNVRQKPGLNREIMRSGWGPAGQPLEDEAPGRVDKVHPAYFDERIVRLLPYSAPQDQSTPGNRG
jgi:hypothetical protein